MLYLLDLDLDQACAEVILELKRANVALVQNDAPSTAGPWTRYSGLLLINGATVTFRRNYSYWCVESDRALSFKQALELNELWKSEVRVFGYSGGLEPDPDGAWMPDCAVSCWHVDTQAGLNALVAKLVHYLVGQNFFSE